ncbi:MAG TPA: hypothetical protein VGE74_10405, partial [Gemmata sp.]
MRRELVLYLVLAALAGALVPSAVAVLLGVRLHSSEREARESREKLAKHEADRERVGRELAELFPGAMLPAEVVPGSKAGPTKPEPKVAKLGEWSRVGDVSIALTGAKVAKIQSKTFGGSIYESKEPELIVSIEVRNHSAVRRLDYSRPGGYWHGVRCADEHGNTYILTPHGDYEKSSSSATIAPGSSSTHTD